MVFLSCKKRGIAVQMQIIDTPVLSKIYKSYWFNKDVGVFCGGEKSTNGYIYKTTDAGNNWTLVYKSNLSLFDIYFVNDTIGYCCGEDMSLLKTINKGQTWQAIDLQKTYSYDNFYNGNLKGIFGDEANLFLVGGKNFNVGIVVRLTNGNVIDGYKGFDNEFSNGFSFATDNYIACGYGTAYKTTNAGANFNPINFSGDNLTGCITLNSSTGLACGYDGGIYKTTNAGQSFTKIFSPNHFYKKRVNFNGLIFIDETTGWVVGNDGIAYKTTDAKKFEKLNLNTKDDLFSIVGNKNNQVIVSTSKGKLIKFSY